MSRTVQLVLVAVNVLFWLAILGWTLVADRPDPRDFVDDTRFAAAAEPICAAAQAQVAALGLPTEVETPEARAELTDAGSAILEAMVAELRGLPPPSDPEQAGWVTRWLDDWATHIQDRRTWAAELHEGRDGPFTETARGGRQISRAIDHFAEVNDMPSCKTSGDV